MIIVYYDHSIVYYDEMVSLCPCVRIDASSIRQILLHFSHYCKVYSYCKLNSSEKML